ncbi:hypothetical protein GCM10027174_43960 [Salinifilum aidingensis]
MRGTLREVALAAEVGERHVAACRFMHVCGAAVLTTSGWRSSSLI